MRSEMTEAEARKAVIGEYGSYIDPRCFDAMAQALGLEFAAEPPPLPASIGLERPDLACGVLPHQGAVRYGALRAAIVPATWNEESAQESRFILAEAVRRYNAYPALRAALAELARQAKTYGPGLAKAIEAAEAALVQAPEGGQ